MNILNQWRYVCLWPNNLFFFCMNALKSTLILFTLTVRQKIFYNRSTFSAAFCILKWVSLKSPSLSMQSNNYPFFISMICTNHEKRLKLQPIVKPLYPYSSSSVESLLIQLKYDTFLSSIKVSFFDIFCKNDQLTAIG